MKDTIEDKIARFHKQFIGLEEVGMIENWIRSALLSQHQSDMKKFKEALGEMEEKWNKAVDIFYCEHCGEPMTQRQQKKLKEMYGKN